jgi:hypothetical protein
MKKALFLMALLCLSATLIAQPLTPDSKTALLKLTLNNKKGGVFSGVDVTFIDQADGKEFKGKTDAKGLVQMLLPFDGNFEVKLSNTDQPRTFPMPGYGGITMESSFSYTAGKEDWSKKYPMTEEDKTSVRNTVASLPDTVRFRSVDAAKLKADNSWVLVTITLRNMKMKPLVGEQVYIVGRGYKKVFQGGTGKDGKITLRLPKGDKFDLNFKYDDMYEIIECKFAAGQRRIRLEYQYLGTREIERRRAAEKKRIADEEIRLARELKEHEARLKREKISAEIALKRDMEKIKYTPRPPRIVRSASAVTPGPEPKKKPNPKTVTEMRTIERNGVLLHVMNRNKQWTDKLIVCDLTGSMNPYAAQLLKWYQLNHMTDRSTEFIFFNDGDRKRDSEKVIGNTGGIYHSKSNGIDALIKTMGNVQRNGGGGDCPENNMEALIKGTKQASSFNDLIMIVDNNAPVKDIKLLKDFRKPVHIILCGSFNGVVHPDYLKIAWKTKGTIHTIEEDITNLSRMVDGKEITIGGATYKLMKNRFVRVTKS